MEQTIDKLQALFDLAENDLQFVSDRLDSEFEEKHKGKPVNLLKLSLRISKIQRDLKQIKADSEAILGIKKQLYPALEQVLTANHSDIKRMQARAGLNVSSSENESVESIQSFMAEWNTSLAEMDKS